MKTLLKMVTALAVVAILTPGVRAQWEKRSNPAVPRLADGQPNMAAPAPRTTDGKPDLSGLWTRAQGDGRGGRGRGQNATPPPPPPPGTPPVATFGDLGTNMPDGLPLTPWAAELKKQRMALNSKENPDANCLPMGLTQFHQQPQPREIIQTPAKLLILYEANYGLRQIYTDGRALPKHGDPQPQWYGYSVGRWEGDTLVVDTTNFTDKTRFRQSGDRLHVIERFTPESAAAIRYDFTVEDAATYAQAWSGRLQITRTTAPMYEYACHEGNYSMVGILRGARSNEAESRKKP
jgi:hypothetical protein